MKRIESACVVLLVLIFIVGLPKVNVSAQRAQALSGNDQSEVRFVPGRLLIKFRQETPALRGREILSGFGARKTGEIPGIGVQIVGLPHGANERAFMQAFKSLTDVEFAELDEILSPADMTPNDPWYANWQWELRKISGPAAWSMTTGAGNVTIAICDTGVDATHPDLAAPGSAFTTIRGGGYNSVGGTSYSSPTVAGVAALVLSANPNLTPSQVQEVLKQSANDLGSAGWDSSYGWGRVNA